MLLNVQRHAPWSDLMLAANPADPRVYENERREAGKHVLAPACVLMERVGIPYRSYVEIGEPAHVIADDVRKHHCGRVPPGTRGRGRFSGLLGSVATQALHLVSAPVILIRWHKKILNKIKYLRFSAD